MGKIENAHQLQLSREAVEGFRQALKHAQTILPDDIRQACEYSTRVWIDRIEREIEEYLAQKVAEPSEDVLQQQREKEADELLALCDAAAEMWEGEFDAAEEVRQMRQERGEQIWLNKS